MGNASCIRTVSSNFLNRWEIRTLNPIKKASKIGWQKKTNKQSHGVTSVFFLYFKKYHKCTREIRKWWHTIEFSDLWRIANANAVIILWTCLPCKQTFIDKTTNALGNKVWCSSNDDRNLLTVMSVCSSDLRDVIIKGFFSFISSVHLVSILDLYLSKFIRIWGVFESIHDFW